MEDILLVHFRLKDPYYDDQEDAFAAVIKTPSGECPTMDLVLDAWVKVAKRAPGIDFALRQMQEEGWSIIVAPPQNSIVALTNVH